MTPIISPWVFYLMSISDPICVVSILIAVVSAILFVGFFVQSKLENLNFGDTDDYNTLRKITKSLLPVLIISTFIAIATPTQSTLTKMLIAQNVTYERVEIVGETVQNVYEDIIALVDGSDESNELDGEE